MSPSATKFCRLCLISRKEILNYKRYEELNLRNRRVGSIAPKYVGAARPKMAIAPKWIGAKKGCEINGEYWSSQKSHDIL